MMYPFYNFPKVFPDIFQCLFEICFQTITYTGRPQAGTQLGQLSSYKEDRFLARCLLEIEAQ
jgi:hypothetical protein